MKNTAQNICDDPQISHSAFTTNAPFDWCLKIACKNAKRRISMHIDLSIAECNLQFWSNQLQRQSKRMRFIEDKIHLKITSLQLF